MGQFLRSLTSKQIQCDEIWSFCYAKKKNVTPEMAVAHPDAGDVWTWTAIDADTKLCVSYFVGDRGIGSAYEFMSDVSARLKNRVQPTTDQHRAYLTAVEDAFAEVDYAQLHKLYTPATETEGRYSPPKCIGCREKIVRGRPDPDHISTSCVERQNLTMRMSMPPVYAPHKCVQQKAAEPHGGDCALLHVLQLRADPPDASGDPGDGGWRGRPRLERRGNRRAARLTSPVTPAP